MSGDKTISDEVRAACAWVAGRARSVGIAEGAIEPYADELLATGAPGEAEIALPGSDREARIAFVICLDAINFGSGWWPTIRKRPGLSGYSTIEAGLVERFRGEGGWSAEELTRMTAAEVAVVTGQD
ncbi:MAG TPA: hypothetical protein VFJ64_12815, partial [Solirubrobacterales bacterium]|nr:hypothetical protein [Solirubrobacterales bacterium]